MNYKLLALDLDGTTLGAGLDIDPAVSQAKLRPASVAQAA